MGRSLNSGREIALYDVIAPKATFREDKKLESLAKALVMAVQYIADRDDDSTEDDDVEMLERIAFVLKQIGKREREALISAAEELRLPEWPSQIGLVPD